MGRAVLTLPWGATQAMDWIKRAPQGTRLTFQGPRRSTPQNDRMWAMLTDISQSEPQGRKHTPDVWKALIMHACGHEVQFAIGLNDEPFPVGFRSSNLTKEQMSDMIEFMFEFGARNGITWSENL